MSLDWKPAGDMLVFREDAFSWQGSIAEDNYVFVRCKKDDARRMTDLSISTLSVDQVTKLLFEFFNASNCLSLPNPGELLLPKLVGSLSSAEVQKSVEAALKNAGAAEVKFIDPNGRDARKSTLVAQYKG